MNGMTMEIEVPSLVPSLIDHSQKYPISKILEIENDFVNNLWEELKRAKVDA